MTQVSTFYLSPVIPAMSALSYDCKKTSQVPSFMCTHHHIQQSVLFFSSFYLWRINFPEALQKTFPWVPLARMSLYSNTLAAGETGKASIYAYSTLTRGKQRKARRETGVREIIYKSATTVDLSNLS